MTIVSGNAPKKLISQSVNFGPILDFILAKYNIFR